MPHRLVLALLLLPVLGGCTAGLATARIVDARRAVREAEEKGAAELAPYELAMARHHLRKAVEESGEAEYGTSMELAAGAKAWAEQALVVSEGGRPGLKDLREDVEELEDLREEPAPLPAPAPPPPRDDEFDDFLLEDDLPSEGLR